MQKQELIAQLTNKKVNAESQIVRFQSELSKNPAHAFSWADSAVKAAAAIDIYRYLLNFLEKETTDTEKVKRFATGKAISAARFPASSTSAISNLVEVNKGGVWAEIADMLE